MSRAHHLKPPVRVVIVDDTRAIRMMIRAMLQTDPRIKVVGEAQDPFEARALIRTLNPDVITLDVVMPRMDGLSFLERLMRLRPMPVVMVSSRTQQNSNEAIRALSLGAVECVDLAEVRGADRPDILIQAVLMAAGSNPSGWGQNASVRKTEVDAYNWSGKIVLIGSSTGGVDALLQILSALPVDCPPVVVCQHMPAQFLKSFAARLEAQCRPRVSLSETDGRLEQGQIFLARGGTQHAVLSQDDPYRLRHREKSAADAYVPSVETLFQSAVRHANQTVSVMLTGMGSDGAQAMLRLRQAGGYTIAQDASTAVIDGMPRSARELGAACEVAALPAIADRILKHTSLLRRKEFG